MGHSKWFLRIASAAVAALALPGCFWPYSGAGSTRAAFNRFEHRITVATVARLEQRWEVTVGGGEVGDPITTIAGVHVGTEGAIYLLDQSTGAVRWQRDAPAGGAVHQPYSWRGHVLAGQTGPAGARSVLDLGAQTGELVREIPGGHLVALREDVAALVSTRVICVRPGVCFSEDTLRVQDLATGEVVYSQAFNGIGAAPEEYTVTLTGDHVLHGGLGLSQSDPLVPAFGTRGYSLSAPGPGSCGVGWVCPNWSVPDTARRIAVSDDETTFFTGSAAYDALTGAELWRHAGAEGPTALAGGRAYTVDSGGVGVEDRLQVFSASGCGAATCEPLWTASVDTEPNLGAPVVQPAVAGGVVFAAGDGDVLYAFDAAGCGAPTCDPLWSATVGGEISGAPAVSDGQVYVGTKDGRVVAFGLPPA